MMMALRVISFSSLDGQLHTFFSMSSFCLVVTSVSLVYCSDKLKYCLSALGLLFKLVVISVFLNFSFPCFIYGFMVILNWEL